MRQWSKHVCSTHTILFFIQLYEHAHAIHLAVYYLELLPDKIMESK